VDAEPPFQVGARPDHDNARHRASKRIASRSKRRACGASRI
jgi:hypothetical protein